MISSLESGLVPTPSADEASYWNEALTLLQRFLYQKGASAEIIRSTTRALKKRKKARMPASDRNRLVVSQSS